MTAATSWQKSTFSGQQGEQCVEVAAQADTIWIRESDVQGMAARASRAGFAALIAGVKAGCFDR
ncbi:DUF397 domain-containing protein [Streptomyces sp. NPDC001667]